ncbi:unnamed protein product, partial [Polarella glacialis]
MSTPPGNGGLQPLSGGAGGAAALLLRPPPAGGAANLLLRPPPAGAANLLLRPPPTGAASLLLRAPPSGAVSLLVRPPPTGAASLLVRAPPGVAVASNGVSPGVQSVPLLLPTLASGSAEAVAAPPAAKAEEYEEDDDFVARDLGDGGWGEDEEEPSKPSEVESKLKEDTEPSSSASAPSAGSLEAGGKAEAGGADLAAADAFLSAEAAPPPRKAQEHIFVTSQPGVGKTTLVQKLVEKLRQEEGEGGVEIVGFYTEEVRDAANLRVGFDVVRVGGGHPDAPSRSVLARLGKAPPLVGKYSVNVAAFEAFALPTLERPSEEEPLPENPRLYAETEDDWEQVVSLVSEPGEDEEGAACIIRLSDGTELSVEPSQLREVPEGWKPEKDEAEEEEEEEHIPRLVICDEVGKMGLLSIQFPKTLTAVLESDGVLLATGPEPAQGQRDSEAVERIKRSPGARVLRLTRGNRDALVDK